MRDEPKPASPGMLRKEAATPDLVERLRKRASNWERIGADDHAALDREAASALASPPTAPEGDWAPHHGRHPWCQPGDEPNRVWRLRFADQDMREMIWTGETAEADAWAAWKQYSPTWNCYLFATVASAPPPPQPQEADPLRTAVERFVKITRDLSDFDGDRRGIIHHQMEAENELARLIGQGELHDLDG